MGTGAIHASGHTSLVPVARKYPSAVSRIAAPAATRFGIARRRKPQMNTDDHRGTPIRPRWRIAMSVLSRRGVETGVPVTLSVEINPEPVAQGQMLAVVLKAQNLAAVNSNISLNIRVPAQVLTFAAASTGGGTCFGSVNCAS